MSSETKCTLPSQGWECTRKAGHEGPCAAIPEGIGYQRLKDLAGGFIRGNYVNGDLQEWTALKNEAYDAVFVIARLRQLTQSALLAALKPEIARGKQLQADGYFCNKCGYVGLEGPKHGNCQYLASRIQPQDVPAKQEGPSDSEMLDFGKCRNQLIEAVYCAKTPDAYLNLQDAQAIADAILAAGYRKQGGAA